MPLYCIAVLRWCYGSLFVNYYWSEGEWLVLYPCPPLTTLHRFWGNALYLFEMLGEKWEIDHSPLGTVYLLSSPAGALSYPNWDEEAHLSLSFSMCRKLGASYRYYKHSVTPLLYSWLAVMKSISSLGPFLNQYWSLSWPVLLRSPTSTGNIYRPVLVSSVTSTGCLPLLYRKDYLASRDCATLSVPLQEECPTQAP